MAKVDAMALDGGDPRLSRDEGTFGGQGLVAYTRPQMRALHDRTVSFEEYFYYAQQTRAEEESHHGAAALEEKTGILSVIFPSKSGKGAGGAETEKRRPSYVPDVNLSAMDQRATVTDEEWANASRAVRTATQGAIFYLITTDILGPYALPFAFSSTGWG